MIDCFQWPFEILSDTRLRARFEEVAKARLLDDPSVHRANSRNEQRKHWPFWPGHAFITAPAVFEGRKGVGQSNYDNQVVTRRLARRCESNNAIQKKLVTWCTYSVFWT